MERQETDASIMRGCRNGDPEARRLLFERHKDRVFSVALNFLKNDHAAAEDVTQDVFVKVFRAARTFRHDASISTWLHRITVNACMDELRRRKRVRLFAQVPARLVGQVGPEEPVEPSARLRAALNRLSDKLRITVLLRHFHDLTYDEIAEALEVASGTVASRLSRAHELLASELAPADVAAGQPMPEPSSRDTGTQDG